MQKRAAMLFLYPLLLVCTACASAGADTGGEIELTLPPATISPTASPLATPSPTLAPTPSLKPTAKPTAKPSPKPTWPMKTFKYKPEGYITADAVNLRVGPGTKYNIQKRVKHYTVVTLLAESGEWYYISLGDTKGFVSKEFVKIGALQTPKPAQRYSNDDIYLAAQMIYLEAKGGTYEEFQAIANVLANRLASRKFPSTVSENIFAPGQFSVADDKTWFLSKKPSKAAIRAANSVLNKGERIFESKAVMYFRAGRLGKDWSSRHYVTTIGNHCFFS